MISQIREFNTIRRPARAYLCYILNRNIPNKLPDIDLDLVSIGLEKLATEMKEVDVAYILDSSGKQIVDNFSRNEIYRVGEGKNRADRAYFYRAVKEKKCILTEPYPSLMTGELCVSASTPIYNDKGELLFVIVLDISLNNIVNFVHREQGDKLFNNFSKSIYSLFSFALFAVAMVLFFNGIKSFFSIGVQHLNVPDMFKSTILLTLSLAIFDLVKTILEEEVFGNYDDLEPSHIHKTMIKFLGSIIIAIAIEALMLVFKFALTNPENLIYATYLIGGVTLLIFGLAYYLKSVNLLEESAKK